MVEWEKLFRLWLTHGLLWKHLLCHRGMLSLLLNLSFEHILIQLLLTQCRLKFILGGVVHVCTTLWRRLEELTWLLLFVCLESSLETCRLFLLPRCPPSTICVERMAFITALCLACEFIVYFSQPKRHHILFRHLTDRHWLTLGICLDLNRFRLWGGWLEWISWSLFHKATSRLIVIWIKLSFFIFLLLIYLILLFLYVVFFFPLPSFFNSDCLFMLRRLADPSIIFLLVPLLKYSFTL